MTHRRVEVHVSLFRVIHFDGDVDNASFFFFFFEVIE